MRAIGVAASDVLNRRRTARRPSFIFMKLRRHSADAKAAATALAATAALLTINAALLTIDTGLAIAATVSESTAPRSAAPPTTAPRSFEGPPPKAVEVARLTQLVRGVGPKAAAQQPAIDAAQSLMQLDGRAVTSILVGMDDAGPLATNWLRSVVEVVADGEKTAGRKLPLADLETFVLDRSHSPRARRLAYELLVATEPAAADRLVPKFADDPSVELRRDAVARLLASAAALVERDKPAARRAYGVALNAARDADQVRSAADELKKLGETVDLVKHFGFVRQWRLIGPFDNTDKRGFAVAYPPEHELKFGSSYPGKVANVSWIEHTSDHENGQIDLNTALGKHMGAAGYAATTFYSPVDRPAEVRVGSANANKVWLNGTLLFEADIYHANQSMDQYIGRAQLKRGENIILVKVCQNEQTDDWAQNWQFQLRVCDATGTAIASTPSTARKSDERASK